MSEEPVAHKNQPPSKPPDAEYDCIYATMAETVQGRRFLQEHARRSRPAEMEVSMAAIERMQAALAEDGAGGRLDLLAELAEMTQAIAQARAEIAALKPPQRADQTDDTEEELDSIVQTTESASSRALTAAERVQAITWALREAGVAENFCDELQAQTTEIYIACALQNLTGQRTRKVIQLLRHLEERTNALAGIGGQEKSGTPAPMDDPGIADNLPQTAADAAMQQDDFAEDRQDATLEDINRFMLALEPLMALHQAAAAEGDAWEQDAGIPPTDHGAEARPELFVADTVMQEAEGAQEIAEWAVESATPAIQGGDAAGAELEAPVAVAEAESDPTLAEWIVEDPEAPRPEAEPAWLVLQRLQNEPDAEPDYQTEAAPLPKAPPQPAETVWPIALMPPPEFNFLGAPLEPTRPLTELAAALAATKIELIQPSEDADTAISAPSAPEPQLVESAPAPAPIKPALPAAALGEEETAAPDLDADDFLFEPEPADQTKPDAQQEAKREEAPAKETARRDPMPAMEWKSGSFPDPALVTPQVVSDSAVSPLAARLAARAPYDPLAPLRALSDEEKIALFS